MFGKGDKLKKRCRIILLSDRYGVIKKLCKNRRVLDVGCVDHSFLTEKKSLWLHKVIKKAAKELVGLDIEKSGIDKLNKKGYNIKYGDAESVNLKKKFEVIIAGEFIEHLSNFGNFLDNMHKHLEKKGLLVLTTPNAFAIRYFLRNLFLGKVIPNKQHTCYFDYYTLMQLGMRHNFKIKKAYYFLDGKKSLYKYIIERFFCSFRKVFAPGIVIIMEKC